MELPNRTTTDEARTDASRRRFIAATTALAVTGTAGCAGILGGGGSGPEAAVESYVIALDEGDVEEANGLLHPDGSIEGMDEQSGGLLKQADISLDSTNLVEEGDDRAVVEASLTMAMMGEEETTEGRFELRTHDGEWKIHSEPT